MSVHKEQYHPNAYLAKIKNIKRGLIARTKVLTVLEKHDAEARKVAEEATLHYSVAMHHLKLLETEGIVERRGSKPRVWRLTGLGQKRLVNAN